MATVIEGGTHVEVDLDRTPPIPSQDGRQEVARSSASDSIREGNEGVGVEGGFAQGGEKSPGAELDVDGGGRISKSTQTSGCKVDESSLASVRMETGGRREFSGKRRTVSLVVGQELALVGSRGKEEGADETDQDGRSSLGDEQKLQNSS